MQYAACQRRAGTVDGVAGIGDKDKIAGVNEAQANMRQAVLRTQ